MLALAYRNVKSVKLSSALRLQDKQTYTLRNHWEHPTFAEVFLAGVRFIVAGEERKKLPLLYLLYVRDKNLSWMRDRRTHPA